MIDKGRKEAMSFDIARKAKLRAVHLLEYRDRTEKDMRRKLQQGGYPTEIIEETMEYLRAYGYIDDKRYAGRYLSSRLEQKGRRRLFQELQQKGIPASVIEEAWEELCLDGEACEDEKGQIGRLAEKKTRGRKELSPKEYQRLTGFLARRGFSWEDISSVFQEKGIHAVLETKEGQ